MLRRRGLHLSIPQRTAITLAYDPQTDTWRRLPDAPLSPQSSEAVLFEGHILAWDYGADSAQFLPAEDRWQGLGRLPLDHGECYVDGVAIDRAVLAWNCGIPDAWYPGLGWTNVDGGPPARQAEIDETYLGSQGRAIAAGSVALVEQVDNARVDKNLNIGSSEAAAHLWIWRPLTSPELPPAPAADGAEYLVTNFLSAWGGHETYLPTLATQDAIDRCRDGSAGAPSSAAVGSATGTSATWSRPRPARSRSRWISAPRWARACRRFSSLAQGLRPTAVSPSSLWLMCGSDDGECVMIADSRL